MSEDKIEDPSPALLAAAGSVMRDWIDSMIWRRLGRPATEHDRERASAVADSVAADVLADLAALLSTDVEDQHTNPLAVIRRHVGPVNDLLAELGAPEPSRDDFDRRHFPDDAYRIGPVTWADIDESLHEPGLRWGAWKAFTVMRRRNANGA